MLGITMDLIDVPSNINASDGGIDAQVTCFNQQVRSGIIKPGLNCYQVKTGDFNPRHESSIRELLFTPRSLRAGTPELQPRVKWCLDQRGRFVVVLFGWDNPDPDESDAAARIRSALCAVDGTYADALIDVWRPNQLMGCFEPHLSLTLDLNGLAGEPFDTHQTWASLDTMRRDYHAGEAQKARIEEIRRDLREVTGAVHIRVFGEPGIGKTRLVLEATDTDDLRTSIVYYESAERLRGTSLLHQIARPGSQTSVILVVDECGSSASAGIWNRLKNAGHRVKFISIHADDSETDGDQHEVPVPPLPDEEVAAIIRSYIQQPYEAERWGALCGGSPRVAHAVGESLQRHPGDLLHLASLDLVWERFLAANSRPDSEALRQHRVALQYLALFRKFGYSGTVAAEARAVARLIERHDPSITWPRFEDIVHELRQRKILQGDRTLYISPRLFHIWLWAGWWQRHGANVRFDALLGELPSSLSTWFGEMFEYAAASDAAASEVRRLLSPAGPFEGRSLLEEPSQARFLGLLTRADPEPALRLLQRVMASWTEGDMQELSGGVRQELVWILERLAQRGELFTESAVLLLRLAETDQEPLR